jgi:hypothetical protein
MREGAYRLFAACHMILFGAFNASSLPPKNENSVRINSLAFDETVD